VEWTTEALIEELGTEKRLLDEALTAWVDRGMIGFDEGQGLWVLYEREEDKPRPKPKPCERALSLDHLIHFSSTFGSPAFGTQAGC
jgi:hypothetical protein